MPSRDYSGPLGMQETLFSLAEFCWTVPNEESMICGSIYEAEGCMEVSILRTYPRTFLLHLLPRAFRDFDIFDSYTVSCSILYFLSSHFLIIHTFFNNI